METTLNLESKEKLDNNSIEKLLKKYLTAADSITVKQVSNVSADNGITYIAKIVADCDSKVLLSQLYNVSRILDQDCIAYSSSDSVIGQGFIGIRPYDRYIVREGLWFYVRSNWGERCKQKDRRVI